jgi:antitoxin (DNA-binding transcriptional repressor) of toxin-antitoxin stability system
MSTHSVAQAKDRLPELITRALEGEAVVITLNGRPAVELKAVSLPGHPVTPAELDWLAQRRIARLSVANDAGSLVSRMRDEDER